MSVARLLILSSLVGVLASACLFDPGPLEARMCGADEACPPGMTCIEGFCATAAEDLVDVPIPEPDVEPIEPDVVDPTPEPEPEPDPCVPEEEVCDGLDNDCDKFVDEDIEGVGVPCREGQGQCEAEGAVSCVDGGMVCVAQAGLPTPEGCDGLDNDCDGEVDEGDDGGALEALCFEGDARFSGVGECAPGLQACEEGGVLGECVGAVYPVDEVCDGLDNDCDGDVDERVCPEEVGCADGGREAFGDMDAFPDLAGCSGGWPDRRSLRQPRASESPCGDDLGVGCETPAELCAPGWVVCAADGNLGVLRSRLVNAGNCFDRGRAGSGRWVAGSSHCDDYGLFSGCDYFNGLSGCAESGDCSEPICCGDDCDSVGCTDALFDGGTRVPASNSDGCSAMGASGVNGVMCCRETVDQ